MIPKGCYCKNHRFFSLYMYLKLALSCISLRVSFSRWLFLFSCLSFDEFAMKLSPSLIES